MAYNVRMNADLTISVRECRTITSKRLELISTASLCYTEGVNVISLRILGVNACNRFALIWALV